MRPPIERSKSHSHIGNSIGTVLSTANYLYGPGSLHQKYTGKFSSENIHTLKEFKKESGSQCLQKRCRKMFLDGEFTDCAFQLTEEDANLVTIKAHKVILIYASDVFRTMFLGSLPAKKLIIISDIRASIFKHLLMFAYTLDFDAGSVSYKENLELAIAANKYLMKDLQKICIDRACSSLVPIRVFAAEKVAELLNEERLAKLCYKMIETSTPSALNSLSFLGVSKERLLALLQMDRLNIPSELTLIAACIDWARHNCRDEEFSYAMRTFLPHFRFLSLRPEEFSANIECLNWLSDSEKLAILVNITSRGSVYKMAMPDGFSKNCKKRMA